MEYKWKKNTAIFLSSQAVSVLGSSLVQFAITSYITVQTKSGIFATIAILCAILPTFILSPFAGVWADKYNRKILIMAADGGIAFCTLIVAILFLTGHGSIYMLLVALIIRGLGSAIQQPCIGALLPDIVPGAHLTRINGINGSMQSLFSLASPVLGAMLLSMVPLGIIFFVDIITAVIAIVIMLTAFRLPEKKVTSEKKVSEDYFSELKLGIKYIFKTPFLVQFFGFCIVFFIMVAPAVFLTQVQVVRNYGDDYWYLSAIEVAVSAGMLVGGIIISLWGGLKNKVHTITLATTIMGICTFALGFRMPFIPYVILMVLFGLSMPFLNTPVITLLQNKVEPQYMGRVFGVMTMINTSMMPLGMVIFGPIADIIAIETLLLGTGIVILLTTLLMTRARTLNQAGA
ncbi:MAG: MFS transporter [Lachnospiraceae bacterium]